MNRLKELRKKKGLTQVKVQIETGIDQADYSKMEHGKRYPTKELSFLFETSLDYIYGITDDPTPYPRSKNAVPKKKRKDSEPKI